MVILPSYSSTYPRLRFPQLLMFRRGNNPKVCIFDVPLVAHVPLWYGRSQETLSRGVLPRVFVEHYGLIVEETTRPFGAGLKGALTIARLKM